ncbi:MAG: ATP-binding protein, partial [Cyanothece sp. SIO1E1]|nr:ATP-binding protein [Cyanothece sp. SIO1E1]
MVDVPTLQQALQYLAEVIQWRLESYFATTPHPSETLPEPPGDWLALETALSRFIVTHQLDVFEQLTLLIALAPHLQPDFFDQAIAARLPEAGDYPQIGGWRGASHRGFLPTGETVLFILAGARLGDRLHWQKLFSPNHSFAQKQVLSIQAPADGEPLMSGRLVLAPDYVNLFMHGYMVPPHFSIQFPAQRMSEE